jgi:hypothetical protein
MRAYDRREPLISIHVPKCGGTSLTDVLRGWFGPGFYRHYYDETRGALPPRRDLRAGLWRRTLLRQPYRAGLCLHGHFNRERGFGIQDYYPQVRQFITVLRDPFEIAISDYFFAKGRGEEWFVGGQRAPIRERYRDFADFFEREVLHRQSYIANHMPVDMTLDNFERVFAQQFIYVGITEDLPATVRRLAGKLGFPPVSVEHANPAPRDEAVAPGLREAFVRTHPLEYAMYEFARAHYQD